MAEANLLHVICYDIENDCRRRRLARLLEKQAIRVQRSVFELRSRERKAQRLASQAARHLGPGDSLRVYTLDRGDRQRCRVYGPGPRVEEQNFYLL